MFSGAGMIHPMDLMLHRLPDALQGLRIAQLSDLHIARPRRRFHQLCNLLSNLRVDLAVFTGDYISKGHHEDAALRVMADLCRPLKPRLGMFGVFGNHDSPDFRRRAERLPIHWLNNQTFRFAEVPLEIIGLTEDTDAEPDSVAALLDITSVTGAATTAESNGQRPFRVILCHYPGYLPVAADLGADLLLSGHTHGGQCRLPGGVPLVNSSDLPLRLTSGILRHRDTLAVVTRGLGEVHLPLRLFCPPQLPVCTLRQGPTPGRRTDHIECVVRW